MLGFLGFMYYVIMFAVSIVFFQILNRKFNIIYIGFKGIFPVWFGCFIAAAFVVDLSFGLIVAYYKWILIIAAVIAAIAFVISRKKDESAERSTEINQEE
jgi:hypothetical protein